MSKNYFMTNTENGKMLECISIHDYQRKKVYKAEHTWLSWMQKEAEVKGSPSGSVAPLNADLSNIFYMFPSVEAVMSYLDELSMSDWMKEKYGMKIALLLRGTKVRRRQGNRVSRASYSTISLAPNWGFRKDVVLHEFAHIIVNKLDGYDGGHGRLFAQTHLFLIEHAINSLASNMLRVSYDKLGVKYEGDDRIFVEEKIKKQNSAVNNGIVVVSRRCSYTTNVITHKINRLPIQKVGHKYVPNMDRGWSGYGRDIEWTHDSFYLNGQKTRLNWDMRYGKYAYFSLTNEDGSIQWYKFRMDAEGFSFNPGYSSDYFDYYLFTPAFAKNHTEEELIAMIENLAK